MSHSKDHYEAGDVLCDMHYGFANLPANLEVVSRSAVYTDEARNILGILGIKGVDNKSLVVIGASCTIDGHLVAAYSYDGRIFGMVTLRYISPK